MEHELKEIIKKYDLAIKQEDFETLMKSPFMRDVLLPLIILTPKSLV